MDVSNIPALSTAMSQTAVKQQVEISTLKKAMDIQEAGALALINAIPQVSSAGLPDNVGQTINTTA
jgi:hypothetical protein